MRVSDFAPGDVLPGTKYQVVRPLAEGGMGVVLEVVKEPQIRGVAKLMGEDLLDDETFRRKFLAEAQILAQLDHPNIVRIFDYDTLADGRPFFVMELLRGQSLEELLVEHKTLPPRVAYRIMRQLLSALDCAHKHDAPVVHRDVKPGNVFIHKPKNGEAAVKLIDFGIVAAANKWTIMAGTHGFMAPEQLRSGVLTARTDVYAAAVVLYEMLVGHGPFPAQAKAGSEALALATLESRAERITRYANWVPESVANAIASALEKDPSARPASARDFLDALVDLDRPDLFGVESEIPWSRDDATPRPPTMASLTAMVRTPNAAVAVRSAPRAAPSALPMLATRKLDTFATHHSDATAARRPSGWRWWVGGVAAASALVSMGAILATKWPRAGGPPSTATVVHEAAVTPSVVMVPAPSVVMVPSVVSAPAASVSVVPIASAVPVAKPRPRASTAPSSSARALPTFEPTIGE
jgi:eukaryotic-like serine/threonine-protein kinase